LINLIKHIIKTIVDKFKPREKKEMTEIEKMDKHFNGKTYVKDGIENDF
tara:strand:+ start:706 stop:852 length:147 start_codon:yes stop_codon:yes gene_type:complete